MLQHLTVVATFQISRNSAQLDLVCELNGIDKRDIADEVVFPPIKRPTFSKGMRNTCAEWAMMEAAMQ